MTIQYFLCEQQEEVPDGGFLNYNKNPLIHLYVIFENRILDFCTAYNNLHSYIALISTIGGGVPVLGWEVRIQAMSGPVYLLKHLVKTF